MKVTNIKPKNKITFNTRAAQKNSKETFQWWKADSTQERGKQLLNTAVYLKENQNYRIKQASIFARLYGNMSLFNFAGWSNMATDTKSNQMAIDRPTFNLVQSSADTLISRVGENRPLPIFLTQDGDYKKRKLAKQLNNFIQGEMHRLDVYEKTLIMLRDALVCGTGVLKIYETQDHKVGIDRVLNTELYVDANESMYGDPRQLYHVKLIDRDILMEIAPGYKNIIKGAEEAYPSSDSTKSVSDQVMVIEGWHLPSGKDAQDGRHTIACSSGTILDEPYNKEKFPFVFLNYSPRLYGFWAQGLAEQLMGTQMEINTMLYVISKAIKLVGVPRVFVEDGSKVVNASHNNDVGVIVKYRGTKPSYEVAPCVPPEMYAQLQRLITYGYQQCGVSALEASSEKPAGLNSGEAIRSYDDISRSRFNSLSKRYDNVFIALAYAITDLASEIAEEQGEYSTVYPSKNGTQEIDLPKAKDLDDPYVVQVFNQSSLPKDPAGRMQKVIEMIQSGMVTIKEGRRLLDYPDLDQREKLANASEERIFQMLDKIVEEGDYTPPDPFLDLDLATELTTQYYNLHVAAKLEEDKAEMLRTFFTQVNALKQQAVTPQAPQGGAIPPQANPQPLPTSDLVPNANVGGNPPAGSAPAVQQAA